MIVEPHFFPNSYGSEIGDSDLLAKAGADNQPIAQTDIKFICRWSDDGQPNISPANILVDKGFGRLGALN